MRSLTLTALTIAIALLANPAIGDDTPPSHAGELTQFVFEDSEIFPGTQRDAWVYVPKQYDRTTPACLATFCDGRNYVNATQTNYVPAIFDKLIASNEMPVTIAVFVNPGVVPPSTQDALPRFNRSYEYDGLGDTYASFLDQELLPFVETKFHVSFSKDPNDRLIGGASSGGIAAFNTAWSRPDLFRRVWCTVGTFVGLRGGDELHSLVRKTEPKPLRLFLHDGSNDLNIYAGDWWIANQQMQRALAWTGYEHDYRWDEVGHGRDGEKKYLTEAMQFLWKDWPTPITTHPENASPRRANFLIDGEDWELVSEGHGFTEGTTCNAQGEVFFTDIQKSLIHKIDLQGNVTVFARKTGGANGLAFAPDGRLIACANGKQQIVAYNPDGTSDVLADKVHSNDVTVRSDGTIYCTNPKDRQVFRIRSTNDGGTLATEVAAEVVAEFPGCNGIQLSPDQSQLYVTDYRGRMITAYQVTEAGDLINGQPFYWLHSPYRTDATELDGMTVDREGWLYATSKLGIQICDQAGRVHLILPPPTGARHPANLCFGGPQMDILYAACGDKVFKRKLSHSGIRSFEAPMTPKKPRL